MEEKEKNTCGCENASCKCEDKHIDEKQEQCNCGEKCNCDEKKHQDNKCSCKEEHKDEHKDKKKFFKGKDETKELKELVEKLKNESLTAKADLINYRKRKDDEVSRMLKYANEDLAKEILPIIDNFERAINMDDDNLEDEVSKFLAGFKMIYCGLVGTMEKYGVKAIDGSNKPFDPTYHQAVMTEHRDGVEPGMVLDVLQKGYLLKDKVIRPAMVRVSE